MSLKPPVGPNTPLGTGRVFYNVQSDFGARGDGTTDDTAAIQAAIAAANAAGVGTVFFPGATYAAHGLSLNDIQQVTLEGASDARQSGARILSSSTGSTAVLSATGASGCRIENLRIENNSASFTGTVLDLTGSVSSDTSLVTVRSCYLRAVAQAGSTVILCKAIKSFGLRFVDTRFYGGKYALRGRASASDYSNQNVVENCHFQGQDTAPIHNPYIWSIHDNIFEPLRDGTAAAILNDAAVPAVTLRVRDNWTGDASASGTWITTNGDDILIEGNRLDTAAKGIVVNGTSRGFNVLANAFNAQTTGLDFGASTVTGWAVVGNYFANLTTGINGASGGFSGSHIAGNRYSTVATPISGNSWGAGSLVIDSDVALTRQDANQLVIANALRMNTTVSSGNMSNNGLYNNSAWTTLAWRNNAGVTVGVAPLVGTATWDPANIADGAVTNTTVTVTGAAVGDPVAVGFSVAVPANSFMVGSVTAADTVTVTLFNKTGGALDLASGTIKAYVWK